MEASAQVGACSAEVDQVTLPEDRGPEVAPADARLRYPGISPALWIPAVYAVVSIAWIGFSDRFVAGVAGTRDAQAFWSTVKGIGFVAVTSLLLALGIRWALRRERASVRRIAESENLFRAGFENHAAVKLLIEPDSGRIVDANHEATTFYGWPRERLREMRIQEINTLPEEAVTAEMRKAQESRQAQLNFRHRLADGSVRDVTVFSDRVLINGRELLHSIVQDITERKQAEQRLAKAQRTLFMTSGCTEAILHAVTESELLSEVCQVVVERGGYRMCWVGVPGDDDRRLVVPVAHAGHEDGYLREVTVSWADVPEGRGPTGTALREGRVVVGKDFQSDSSLAIWTEPATRRGYRTSLALPLIRGDERFGVLTMYADDVAAFSEEELALLRTLADDIAFGVQALRQRAQRASAEALLRAIANSSPDSIFAKDRDGRWIFANAAALQIARKPAEEVLGKTDAEIMGDAGAASPLVTNDREVMEAGTARSFEEDIPGPTGTRLFLSTKAPLRDPDGHVVGIAGVAKDVTELRKLQDQLAVTSRLAAMGTLVAGVSHEVNNPLAGVLAGTGIATEEVKEARRLLDESSPASGAEVARRLDEALASLADAQSGSQRIAQIVKDLSLFARPNPQRARMRIAQVADQAMRWLPVSVGTAATIRVEDRGAPDVMASFGQIGQVLVNLVTNAAKAMPRGRKGEIVVRLGPGGSGMARLEVIDNGVGMAPNVIERIFDPFFTTRSAGEGTGLGLPIIHSIVTAHGGTIAVESEVGKGSTFRVELPAAPAEG